MGPSCGIYWHHRESQPMTQGGERYPDETAVDDLGTMDLVGDERLAALAGMLMLEKGGVQPCVAETG